MIITEIELQKILSEFLQLSDTKIFIIKNGKIIAELSNPFEDLIKIAGALAGIIPADIILEEAREGRLNRI